jgi:hypothetical protein
MLTDNLLDCTNEILEINIPRHQCKGQLSLQPIPEYSLTGIAVTNATSVEFVIYGKSFPLINLGNNFWSLTREALPLDKLTNQVQVNTDGTPKTMMFMKRTQQVLDMFEATMLKSGVKIYFEPGEVGYSWDYQMIDETDSKKSSNSELDRTPDHCDEAEPESSVKPYILGCRATSRVKFAPMFGT